MSLPRVIVFVRAPELGRVKTRLAATLGAERALSVYRELLGVTLDTLRPHADVELRITPDGAAEGFGRSLGLELPPDWRIRSQGVGDLGARLSRAVEEAFATASGLVVAIGCDCPEITLADVEEAGRLLSGADVVFGPANDGGYWLIGLKRPVPEVFQGIAWGGPQVLAQSLDQLSRKGLTALLLRPLGDIDTAADWQAWQARSTNADSTTRDSSADREPS